MSYAIVGNVPHSVTSADGGVNPDSRLTTSPATAPSEREVPQKSHRVVLAGAALIALTLGLRAWVLRHAYFIEDDFLFVADAAASPLTVEYLTELHKGHLMPGAKLLVAVLTALSPYNWTLAAGTMLALHGAAAAATFRLLGEVWGWRWAILAPLAVAVCAPLTVPVLAWWSAALNAIPFQLATALALLWTVRYLRHGRERDAWLAAAAVVGGMAFSVKALLLPLLLFAVAVAFHTPGPLTWAPSAALRARPRFWTGMGALFLGYLVVYMSRPADAEGAGVPALKAALGQARRLLLETFPVGAVGGPFSWGPVTPAGGLLQPHPALVAAAWTVLAAMVGVSLLHRPRWAWRAWALLVGYLVCVDLVPTLVARGRYHELVGYDPRYVADAALVFAFCVAWAFLAPRWEESAAQRPVRQRIRLPRRLLRGTAAGATAGFVAAASVSTAAYADTLSGDRVHWYLDTVRASLAAIPEEAGVFPRPVPEDIVLPWNGHRRFSSFLLSPLAGDDAERIADPQPAALPMVLNDAGFLVVAEPAPDSVFLGPPDDGECVETLDGQVLHQVSTFGHPGHVLGLSYVSDRDAETTVGLDTVTQTTVLPAAPYGGSWYVPLTGKGQTLVIKVPDEVCLTWVTFGELVPSVEGNPWEQEDLEEKTE